MELDVYGRQRSVDGALQCVEAHRAGGRDALFDISDKRECRYDSSLRSSDAAHIGTNLDTVTTIECVILGRFTRRGQTLLTARGLVRVVCW